jgi:hypothetical protein
MILVFAVLLGCSGTPGGTAGSTGAAPQAPAAAAASVPTRNGLYRVEWHTVPDPIVLSELFEVEATVTDKAGNPVEDGTVRIDARMPQHGHGMATRPEDDPGECDAAGKCRHPGGVYRTRGMKFHMPGDWTVTFDVVGPAGEDRLEALRRI